MDTRAKDELITRNLAEVIGADELAKRLEQGKQLRIYWGTAPTGKPHIGYLVPLTKIAHFLKAGCKVVVMFADLHAFLDSGKTKWDLLDHRTRYYEEVIKATLRAIGVDIELLSFRRGTSYQLSREYTLDVYKMLSHIPVNDAQKAGAEVVKQSDNPLMSSLVYPVLQALDEKYLDVDAEFGGVDQRKIFALSRDYLPKIGYKPVVHLMNPMMPSFSTQGKMSSSAADSKIDLLDSEPAIRKKINKAFCEEGNVENNPLLTFLRYVVFPLLDLRGQAELVIERPERFGGDASFASFEAFKSAFESRAVHPVDLKACVTKFLVDLLRPVRALFEDAGLQRLVKDAYPN